MHVGHKLVEMTVNVKLNIFTVDIGRQKGTKPGCRWLRPFLMNIVLKVKPMENLITGFIYKLYNLKLIPLNIFHLNIATVYGGD